MSLDAFVSRYPLASLALADGSVFSGYSIGAERVTEGEVVFNTSMTGYQEVLTDPSYSQQIVTLTAPHIGNVGVNWVDVESSGVHAAGLIIRDLSLITSSWRSDNSLELYLKDNNVVALAGIDTRRLTRHLRDHGAQGGSIAVGPNSAALAQQRAKLFPGLEGVDLAKNVSTECFLEWRQGTIDIDTKKSSEPQATRFHVVAYDFGVKYELLRLMVNRGCRVTLVPAKTSAHDVLLLNPDGVFLSNGPGDPAACNYAISNTRKLLEKNLPVFGICLGFQILALALGAKTLKMKFGHHGANHPVQEVATGRVFITSQNHSFSVDEASLPPELRVTHRSLFDGTLQGIVHCEKPILAFQGHPEASPGPNDIRYLFDQFVELMDPRGN